MISKEPLRLKSHKPKRDQISRISLDILKIVNNLPQECKFIGEFLLFLTLIFCAVYFWKPWN